jgi:hypothetical protein
LTVEFGVPVNVTVALLPRQTTEVVDDIVTTGSGKTVIVTEPDTG